MMTDPARKRRTDPGNPDVCPVYDWHKLFSPQETLDMGGERLPHGRHRLHRVQIGDGRPSDQVDRAGARAAQGLRAANPQHVLDILDAGSKRARMVAQQTMDRVREAVFGWDKTRAESAQRRAGGAQNVKAGG